MLFDGYAGNKGLESDVDSAQEAAERVQRDKETSVSCSSVQLAAAEKQSIHLVKIQCALRSCSACMRSV